MKSIKMSINMLLQENVYIMVFYCNAVDRETVCTIKNNFLNQS